MVSLRETVGPNSIAVAPQGESSLVRAPVATWEALSPKRCWRGARSLRDFKH